MSTTYGNRYELGRSIGHGGMSDVYAATDTLLGRDVALKVLRLELARDDSFKERFRREAQNASKLNHPNIVAVYDTGEESIDGVLVPYIVMELVHGRTLRDIVKESGPYTPQAAAQLLIPVCSALQASHDAGIVHRDIKPANIMVTNTGEVKVMDFGIARALDDATSTVTQTSAVIGTAQYLSPEQARGKTADPRSDVYALGCVLYEAVTAHPPFHGDSPFDVAYQHVHDAPEPPSEYIDDLSPTAALNVDAVILTAMAKHPDDRYQSAAEFATDLELLARNAVCHAAKTHLPPSAARTMVQGYPATTMLSVDDDDHDGYPEDIAYDDRQPIPPSRRGDRGQHQQASSSPRWGVWATSILAVIVVAIGSAFVYDYVTHGHNFISRSQAKLPNVAGLPEDDARAKLEDAGFTVLRSEEPSPKVRRGIVIRTDPASDSELPKKSTVTLIVSSGKEIVEVPDVTHMNAEKAFEVLKDAGLKLNPTPREDASDDVKEGDIIEQTPVAGSQVSKGSEVTITISTGVEKVRIPSLSGMKFDEARKNLEDAGFVVQPEYVDSDQPEGTVVDVAGADSEVDKGATVVVRVSSGSHQITMPNVAGLNRNQAITALRRAGWKGNNSLINNQRLDTDNLTKQNTVASQDPAPGTPLGDKDPVTLTFFTFNPLQIG